ncbi:MAG: DNA topoisomerase IV subunit A, partial [Spirochaetes bacterium]
KIPVLLIQGAEGIAVGMATKILPHNFNEVLEAVISALHGESLQLFPDFIGGGFIDVSDYQDGLGKVLVRAKFDTSDSKKIIIKEIPFGTTTESLITSIENAARKGKIKIGSINDFTTDKIEIEIKLPRNVHTSDIVDALYAFTDCENSISINLLVIKDNMPTIMTVSEVINYHAKHLLAVLKAELKVTENELKDKIHARTLERIFIEERIYKDIEDKSTGESVRKAVIDGFIPYKKEIKREVTEEDVERLLKIPIRRISLYDINKARKEIQELNARLKDVRYKLKNLTEYAVSFLEDVLSENRSRFERKTKIISFKKIDVREAAKRDADIYYDSDTGYLGTDVKTGNSQFKVSAYDRILIIRKNGIYSITAVPHRLFVDKGMLYCGLADKDTLDKVVFSVLFQNKTTKYVFVKRFRIEKFILDKSYDIVPEDGKLLKLSIKEDIDVVIIYVPKPRIKKLEENLPIGNFLIKNVRAGGNRLSTKEIKTVKFMKSRS